ncbi:MAG: hypothetical protein HN380_05310 [Victivallales bacterium]|nr:hypothetical protein [Victivallales bacterium]
MRGLWLLALVATVGVGAAPLRLYVSPKGNDEANGLRATASRTDGPFLTVARARDEIRRLRKAETLPAAGAIVQLAPGAYYLAESITMDSQDGGTAAGPIVYQAEKAGTARLSGGVPVTAFGQVTDKMTRARLDAGAQDHVMVADLGAAGVVDFGEPCPNGMGCEVFFETQPMPLARWPNDKFAYVAGISEKKQFKSHGRVGSKDPTFTYEGDRPSRWQGETEGWLNGFWFWDWAEGANPIVNVDPAKRQITLGGKPHSYGIRPKQWYYALNLLCELDRPGEWMIDRTQGKLYFWPPRKPKGDRVVVSRLLSALSLENVSHVRFRGLVFEAVRNHTAVVKGGQDVRFEACTFRNTGMRAVVVTGGKKHAVVGCDIYDTGNGAVSLGGGDRATLAPSEHVLENTWIRRYGRLKRSFCTAVSLSGVGQTARRNLIHDAPYIALWFSGNDHLVEGNEIHSVCYEANDSGAIYAGRDWSACGTVIRHNYVHDVTGFKGRGCNGIYLDDMFSGTLIEGNVIVRVPRAFLIGGGRNNHIHNNIMADCKNGMHIDARALGWAKASVAGVMTTRLKSVPYTSPLWRERYPWLAKTLDDEPGVPKGNVVERNISWNSKFDRIHGKAKEFGTIRDNLTDDDPRFRNAKKDDYRLRKDSPAWALGFKPIPWDRIGVYRDPARATWPVRHKVRPIDAPPKAEARKKPVAGPPPVLKASQRTTPIAVDGIIKPEEWSGLSTVLDQGLGRSPTGLPSKAWVRWDKDALWIAIDSPVGTAAPITKEARWALDAVEVAIRNPAAKGNPIVVLRGFPAGTFLSSTEAGATAAQAKQASQGVAFAATIPVPGRWQCEWKIPFASLGLAPGKGKRIPFNMTVRKNAAKLWVMWSGTLDLATWDLQNGGLLELAN